MKNIISKLTTPNLILRKLEIEDATALRSLLARNKNYMLPWIPWAAGEPESIETKKEKIRNWNGEFNLDQKYTYGIIHDDNVIGLSFLFTRQGPGILEIGYVIDFEHTGKGFATESTYALTKLSFAHIQIEKVVIHCNAKNISSAKIPEKLGFKLEGIHRVPSAKEVFDRNENMIWGMFIDEFEVNEKYEPVEFIKESGW